LLKKIPPILSPLIVKTMMNMGRGEEIVIANADFPTDGAKRILRMDGHDACSVLSSMLELFPLDTSVMPVTVVELKEEKTPEIWEEYRLILQKSEEAVKFKEFDIIDKYAFENRVERAYAVIITGEKRPYADVILTKGTV